MKIKVLNTTQANFTKRLGDHLSFKQGNYDTVERTVEKILKKIEISNENQQEYISFGTKLRHRELEFNEKHNPGALSLLISSIHLDSENF